MHLTFIWNKICKHKLTIILSVIILVLSILTLTEFKTYTEMKCMLDTTINEQSNIIQEIKSENADLKAYISKLEEEKTMLEDEIEELNILKQDFKSYMPYTAITSKSSVQYKLQQQASTDSDGIRCLDSKPMVAVGTGWGLTVGDSALVICENGNNFEVIIGDIKADIHTISDNKTTIINGCRCEFIVDTNSLNITVKYMGNVAVLEEYSGYITDIIKI